MYQGLGQWVGIHVGRKGCPDMHMYVCDMYISISHVGLVSNKEMKIQKEIEKGIYRGRDSQA